MCSQSDGLWVGRIGLRSLRVRGVVRRDGSFEVAGACWWCEAEGQVVAVPGWWPAILLRCLVCGLGWSGILL